MSEVKNELPPYLQLEQEFAEFCDYPPENVVCCASGTAALHLALECFDLPRLPAHPTRVLVPDFSMIACARAVTLAGYEPRFIGCDNQLLMDVSGDSVQEALRGANLTNVIMPVHIYGRRCDMNRIADVARDNRLLIVEDIAEAHGVPPHPATDAACWSFYRNKIVAGEEGGAIAFKSAAMADKARSLRSMGFTDKHDFWHVPRAHNYRMSDLHATAILKSLRNFDRNSYARRTVESFYQTAMIRQGVGLWRMPKRDAVWVYDVRIPGMSYEQQAAVVSRLNEKRIGARQGFKPLSQQAEYGTRSQYLSPTDKIAREVLYLPVDPSMAVSYDRCLTIVKELVAAVNETWHLSTSGTRSATYSAVRTDQA